MFQLFFNRIIIDHYNKKRRICCYRIKGHTTSMSLNSILLHQKVEGITHDQNAKGCNITKATDVNRQIILVRENHKTIHLRLMPLDLPE